MRCSQYPNLTGSGNTITAEWVPVVTATGTEYKNVTLLFDVDASGNLTLASGYPLVVPSPTPLVYAFQAGTYVGPSTINGGKNIITISGPGIRTGGTTEWSLAASTGASIYTYPSSASWYVGPISSSPLAARLKAAGITSNAYMYGTGTSSCGCGDIWLTNSLLGFSQTNGALTIVSFTAGGKDFSVPQDQITYMLQPQP